MTQRNEDRNIGQSINVTILETELEIESVRAMDWAKFCPSVWHTRLFLKFRRCKVWRIRLFFGATRSVTQVSVAHKPFLRACVPHQVSANCGAQVFF